MDEMKINYGGNKLQKEMLSRGWRIEIRDTFQETPEQMFVRLSAKYKKVKIYWCATAIRGLHEYFAFCKN